MPPTPNQAKWTDDHDHVLLTAAVQHVLANRRAIYATPGLEDVSGNGGSRINQRLQLMLRKMLAAFPNADTAEILDKAVGKGSKVRQPNQPKVKAEVKNEVDDELSTPSKKRRTGKIKKDDDEVEKDEEEMSTPTKKRRTNKVKTDGSPVSACGSGSGWADSALIPVHSARASKTAQSAKAEEIPYVSSDSDDDLYA